MKLLTIVILSVFSAYGDSSNPNEKFEMACASTLMSSVDHAYQNSGQYITPIFDAETDAKLVAGQQEALKDTSKLIEIYRNVAFPVLREKASDEFQMCITLMKIKQDICGEDFIQNDCDPTFSKRADGKAMFDAFKAKIGAKYLRAKTADVASSEQELKSSLDQIMARGWYLVGGLLLILASLIAYVAFRPPRICPSCSAPLPRLRTPGDVHELLWGGWTCQKCGAKWTWRLKKRF